MMSWNKSAVLLLVVAVGACTSGAPGTVEFEFTELKQRAALQGLTLGALTATVTADDLAEPIVEELEPNGSNNFRMRVPPGPDRRFVVQADIDNGQGGLIPSFWGETTKTVRELRIERLLIPIFPAGTVTGSFAPAGVASFPDGTTAQLRNNDPQNGRSAVIVAGLVSNAFEHVLPTGTYTLGGAFGTAGTPTDSVTVFTVEQGVTLDLGTSLLGPNGFAVCGDADVDDGEQCDDGGLVGGDCCDAQCQFEAAESSCEDGLACNGAEVCDGAGVCVPGTPLDVDDEVDCTVDTCVEGQQGEPAMAVNTADDQLCDDGNACTVGACYAGGQLPPPDGGDGGDGGPLPDGEDPPMGCIFFPIPDCCNLDSECNEPDDPCSVNTCDLTTHTCEENPPVVCDDNNDCSTDACNGAGGCTFTAPPRDIVVLVDLSKSMNFDSQFALDEGSIFGPPEGRALPIHQALDLPAYGNMPRPAVDASQMTEAQLIAAQVSDNIQLSDEDVVSTLLGLSQVAYPRVNGSWLEYVQYVRGLSEPGALQFGHYTLVDYWLSQYPGHVPGDPIDFSLVPEQPIATVRTVVTNFINRLVPGADRVAIITYSPAEDTATIESGLTEDFASALAAIPSWQAARDNKDDNLAAALLAARTELTIAGRVGAEARVVIFSAGPPELPVGTAIDDANAEALALSQESINGEFGVELFFAELTDESFGEFTYSADVASQNLGTLASYFDEGPTSYMTNLDNALQDIASCAPAPHVPRFTGFSATPPVGCVNEMLSVSAAFDSDSLQDPQVSLGGLTMNTGGRPPAGSASAFLTNVPGTLVGNQAVGMAFSADGEDGTYRVFPGTVAIQGVALEDEGAPLLSIANDGPHPTRVMDGTTLTVTMTLSAPTAQLPTMSLGSSPMTVVDQGDQVFQGSLVISGIDPETDIPVLVSVDECTNTWDLSDTLFGSQSLITVDRTTPEVTNEPTEPGFIQPGPYTVDVILSELMDFSAGAPTVQFQDPNAIEAPIPLTPVDCGPQEMSCEYTFTFTDEPQIQWDVVLVGASALTDLAGNPIGGPDDVIVDLVVLGEF